MLGGKRVLLFCAKVVLRGGVSGGVLGLIDLAMEVVDLIALEFELATPTHQKDKEEEEGKVADPEGQSDARIDLVDFQHGVKRAAQFDGEINKRDGDRSHDTERSSSHTDLMASATIAAEDKVCGKHQPKRQKAHQSGIFPFPIGIPTGPRP